MTIPVGAFPLVQLVSSPDADAEIFFDCNDGFSWPAHEGFTFGAPPLLGDPGGVGAEYGYRQLNFTLIVQGDEDTALRQQSELARQVLRDVVYLRFQLSNEASSIWFRCVRSSPGESSLSEVYLERHENQWRIAVNLVAEPDAQGELVSHVVTVANDPAAANGAGLSVTLPEIRGDFPAPLNVDITPGATLYMRPWLSVCPLEGSRAWTGPVFVQGESGTPGVGALNGTATGYSGGRRVSLSVGADNDEGSLATWTMTPPYAGRWRIFARAVYTPSTTSGTMHLHLRGAGSAVSSPKLTVMDVSHAAEQEFMVDLGVYTFPKGNVPTSRPYVLSGGGVAVNWSSRRSSTSTGRLSVDYVVAVPCDLPLDATGPCVTTDFQNRDQTLGAVTLRLNADDAVVQEFTAGVTAPTYAMSNPETPAGEFPAVTPGALNVLTLLTRRSSERGRERDTITDTTTMTVSYRPRWLYHAGA